MAEAWTCLDCGFRSVHRRGSPAAYYHAVGHQKLTQHQIQGLIDDKGTVLVEGLDQEAARTAGYLSGKGKGATAPAPAPASSSPPAEDATPAPSPAPSPASTPAPAPEPAPLEAPMPQPVPPTQDPLAEPLAAGGDEEGEGITQGQGGDDPQGPGGYADPFAVDPNEGGGWGRGGGGGVLSPGGGAPPPPFNPDQAAGAGKPPIEGSIPFIRFTPDFMVYLCFYCDLEENPELYKGLATEDALAAFVNACCVADLMRKAHEAHRHKGIVGAIGKSLAFLQQQQGALFIEDMYRDCMQQVLADLVQRGTIPVDIALQQGLRPPSAPVGGLG